MTFAKHISISITVDGTMDRRTVDTPCHGIAATHQHVSRYGPALRLACYGARLMNSMGTMANHKTRRVDYTPKLTDNEAYDLLPPALRVAVRNAVSVWSSAFLLGRWNTGNYSICDLIKSIEAADHKFMSNGWIPAKGRRPQVPSTFFESSVDPLKTEEARRAGGLPAALITKN